jgi:hypothetical protein
MRRPGSNADPLWYQDASICELHVKCFSDSTSDGIGDFRGLSGKLDHLQALGIERNLDRLSRIAATHPDRAQIPLAGILGLLATWSGQ